MGGAAEHRFGRDRRVRKRAEFLRIQSIGRRVMSPHFTFLLATMPDRGSPARLGVVVTRKLGGAVVRNRIKRLCRECFRLWPAMLPSGVDLVVIARAGAASLDLSTTQGEWRGAHRALTKRAEEALALRDDVNHVSARAAPPRHGKPPKS